MLSPRPGDSEGPKHDFCFHEGRIIIESYDHSQATYEEVKKQLKSEFREFKYAVEFYLTDVCKSDSPEIWQKWWANRLVGNDDEFMMDDDGPWNSPKKLSVQVKEENLAFLNFGMPRSSNI